MALTEVDSMPLQSTHSLVPLYFIIVPIVNEAQILPELLLRVDAVINELRVQ